ncbi:MAG: DUF177 domain-containing protein [Bacteroidales bacterium]|nr:DUF177 domain-containing protein [Bacteroidales bacterium]
MAGNVEYIIPCKGLKDGSHEYSFHLGQRFFDDNKYAEIENGNVDVILSLQKKNQFMELFFKLQGTVSVVCDRCLALYDEKVRYTGKLVVKFQEGEDTDEIMHLGDGESEVDLEHYLYESVVLSLPLKKAHHKLQDCNPEFLSRIKNPEDSTGETDPRWDKLKDLL